MSSSDSRRGLTPEPETSSLGEVATRARSAFGNWIGSETRDAEEYLNSSRAGMSPTSSDSRGNAEQIEPPRDAYAKYRRQFDTTPLLSAPIMQMEDDVLGDGWRIAADSDRTADFLEKWGEACAIVAGTPDRDLKELLALWLESWFIYGTPLVENVPARRRPDAIAAFKMVPPATISYHTRPGSSMLLRPDDTDVANKVTSKGYAAAYTQYDMEADETWTDGTGQRLPERRLDATQIIKAERNPDIGDVTGVSVIEAVSEQVETMKETFRNDSKAIESQAWGQWFAGFEPMVIDTPEGKEIIEFDDGAQTNFEREVERVEPGGIVTHDGQINVQNLPGNVADVVDRYTFFTKYILTAMPAPKFTTGFSDNVNRDIAEDKNQRHQQRVDSIQETIGDTFSPALSRVAEQHGYDPSGVRLKLEPPSDDSPILSLDDSDIANIETYAKALETLSGKGAPATTLVNEEAIRDLILQLPDDAGVDTIEDASIDESDPESQKQFAKLGGSIDSLGMTTEQ